MASKALVHPGCHSFVSADDVPHSRPVRTALRSVASAGLLRREEQGIACRSTAARAPETRPDRILSRIRFHHTPAHASWLNMAEIEIGVLEEQCLDRRLPDEFTLGTEVVAWEDRRNQQQAKIHWTFTRQKAKKVFCKDQSFT